MIAVKHDQPPSVADSCCSSGRWRFPPPAADLGIRCACHLSTAGGRQIFHVSRNSWRIAGLRPQLLLVRCYCCWWGAYSYTTGGVAAQMVLLLGWSQAIINCAVSAKSEGTLQQEQPKPATTQMVQALTCSGLQLGLSSDRTYSNNQPVHN